MRAIKFINMYGWDAAKAKVAEIELLEDLGDEICGQQIVLKRIVESHDLVESFNGLEMAKRFLDENVGCCDSDVLKQAITDEEAVNNTITLINWKNK